MKPEKLPLIGAIGTGVMAICCLTPLLVAALAALGLTAFGGYLGALLALVVAMFAVRIRRTRRERVQSDLRGVADPVAKVDMG